MDTLIVIGSFCLGYFIFSLGAYLGRRQGQAEMYLRILQQANAFDKITRLAYLKGEDITKLTLEEIEKRVKKQLDAEKEE